MATSSEELSAQAEQLIDIISFFKSGTNGASRKTITNRRKQGPHREINFGDFAGKNKGMIKINLKEDSDADFMRF